MKPLYHGMLQISECKYSIINQRTIMTTRCRWPMLDGDRNEGEKEKDGKKDKYVVIKFALRATAAQNMN